MEMPSSRRQLSVEEQSAAVEKFDISVRPSASAPINAARWDIDLSPGSRRLPLIKVAGFSLINDSYGTLRDTKGNNLLQIAHPTIVIFPFQRRFSPVTSSTKG